MKMMARTIGVAGTVVFFAVAPAHGTERVGTASAQFLKLGVGARPTALGEAFTAFSGDVACLFWNPAGVAPIERTSLQFSHLNLYLGIQYDFAGLVLPVGLSSAVGIYGSYLTSGDIEITTLEEQEGTGRFFQATGLCLGLTCARTITDRLLLGASMKYVEEHVYHEAARTVGLDLGAILHTGLWGLDLGLTLANLGGDMRLHGEDLRVRAREESGRAAYLLPTEKWPLPQIIRLGFVANLVGPQGQLLTSQSSRLSLAVDVNDPSDGALRCGIGLEYQWLGMFTLRVGPRINYDTARTSFGGGLKYRLNGNTLLLDYAFSTYRDLGGTHQFSLGVQL